MLDFAPFRGSYVREFELSHSKLVNRIIKITLAHNLHVKMFVFKLNYVSCNVKVDNLTFINICETVFNSDNLFLHVLKAIAS